MTDRPFGFYWVRLHEGDASRSGWKVGEWMKMAGGIVGWRVDGVKMLPRDVESVGERILRPDDRPLPDDAALDAMLWAFRNSSWHELSPTDIDLNVDRRVFLEVLAAAAPVPALADPEAFDAAVAARTEELRALHPTDPNALRDAGAGRLAVAEGVIAYPLKSHLWFRNSTKEWVLQLSGAINDTSFHIRHTQPGDLAPEDALGLPTHYALIDACETLCKRLDVEPGEGMEGLVYLVDDDLADNELHGPTAEALIAVSRVLEGTLPAPVIMPDAEDDDPYDLRPLIWEASGALARENEGRDVFLRGTVAYPGSKVTDILIGGQTVQMSNPCLRRALGEDTPEGDVP